jgi:hypothetical protein
LAQLRVGLLSVASVVSEERPATQRRLLATRTRRQIEERFWLEKVRPSLGCAIRGVTPQEYSATG